MWAENLAAIGFAVVSMIAMFFLYRSGNWSAFFMFALVLLVSTWSLLLLWTPLTQAHELEVMMGIVAGTVILYVLYQSYQTDKSK